jgi:hypothetical protein
MGKRCGLPRSLPASYNNGTGLSEDNVTVMDVLEAADQSPEDFVLSRQMVIGPWRGANDFRETELELGVGPGKTLHSWYTASLVGLGLLCSRAEGRCCSIGACVGGQPLECPIPFQIPPPQPDYHHHYNHYNHYNHYTTHHHTTLLHHYTTTSPHHHTHTDLSGGGVPFIPPPPLHPSLHPPLPS